MSATSVSDILGTIMNIVYVAFFVFSFFFSQKIQTIRTSHKLSKALTKLGRMRDKTKQEIISAIPKDNSNEKNIKRLNLQPSG